MTHRDISVIGSTIRNGRIYFPTTDAKFFPADAYGDRIGDGHRGVPVVFQAAGLTFASDIRISSGQRLSPRCTFGKFLKKVGAAEGASLRVTRVTEREYAIVYLPPV